MLKVPRQATRVGGMEYGVGGIKEDEDDADDSVAHGLNGPWMMHVKHLKGSNSRARQFGFLLRLLFFCSTRGKRPSSCSVFRGTVSRGGDN